MNPGDVYKTADPAFWQDHPFIVLSLPTPSGKVVVTNLTDPRNTSDRSCEFKAREHPAVTKDCVVFYLKTTEHPNAPLDEAVAKGLITKFAPLTPEQWARVLVGCSLSSWLAPRHRSTLVAQGLLRLSPGT